MLNSSGLVIYGEIVGNATLKHIFKFFMIVKIFYIKIKKKNEIVKLKIFKPKFYIKNIL
mgnify:CR=1 FL=1